MTLKSIKHKYGKYQKQTNNSFKLIEYNHRIGLTPNAVVGITYEIKSSSLKQLKCKREYIYSDGNRDVNESIINTNELLASILTFHTVEKNTLGEAIFRVSFPDHPEIKVIEQIFYLYDKSVGTLFQNKPFLPASTADISEFENKYKTSLKR